MHIQNFIKIHQFFFKDVKEKCKFYMNQDPLLLINKISSVPEPLIPNLMSMQV